MTISSPGIKFFRYHQETPSDTWIIIHNFGSMPSVDINADLDDGIIGKAYPLEVLHNDANSITVTWSSPRSGYANLAGPSI